MSAGEAGRHVVGFLNLCIDVFLEVQNKRYGWILYLIDYIVYGFHLLYKINISQQICWKPMSQHPGLATSAEISDFCYQKPSERIPCRPALASWGRRKILWVSSISLILCGKSPGPNLSINSRYLPGTWYPVPGTRYPVPGTRYLVTGTRYLVPDTRYLVPGTWYQVIGTRYLVSGTH